MLLRSPRVFVASTLSDLHSAITAAIGALKGPLHGGANERVLEVLQEVGSPERAETWIRTALAQKRKIMGFGHRVYKVEDPRATLLKSYCDDLAQRVNQLGMEQMADTLEQIIRAEKKLPAACRLAQRAVVSLPAPAGAALHNALCCRARRWLGGARDGATRRQSDHPAPRQFIQVRRREPGKASECRLAASQRRALSPCCDQAYS